MDAKILRWGYHPTEPARTFEPGEKMPPGWYNDRDKCLRRKGAVQPAAKVAEKAAEKVAEKVDEDDWRRDDPMPSTKVPPHGTQKSHK